MVEASLVEVIIKDFSSCKTCAAEILITSTRLASTILRKSLEDVTEHNFGSCKVCDAEILITSTVTYTLACVEQTVLLPY